MSENLAGLVNGSASAPAPAEVDNSIESVRREFEERFKGLQRVIAEKDQALEATNKELYQLKTAGLSDDERAQLETTRLREQLDQLAKENELMKLAQSYGEEIPLFQKLLGAETAEEQLRLIREIRAGQAASQDRPSGNTPDVEVPGSSPINPMRPDALGATKDGMSGDIADRILESFKGALRPRS